MKNYALSPLIEIWLWWRHQNERNVICLVGNCLSYNISKFGRNWSPVSEITSIERRTLWRHQWKLNSFELRCKYDDFLSLCGRHGGMESYLQLMLFPTMKNWGSCTIHRNWCRSSIGWGVICDLELGNFFFFYSKFEGALQENDKHFWADFW